MKRNLNDGLSRIVDELVRRGVTLKQARKEFERQFIVASIRSNEGNLGRSAQSMGVHRNTLRNKVSDLGIETEDLSSRTGRRRLEPRAGTRRASDPRTGDPRTGDPRGRGRRVPRRRPKPD